MKAARNEPPIRNGRLGFSEFPRYFPEVIPRNYGPEDSAPHRTQLYGAGGRAGAVRDRCRYLGPPAAPSHPVLPSASSAITKVSVAPLAKLQIKASPTRARLP